MTEIRLVEVEDWASVKVGDPVRLVREGTQVNALVAAVDQRVICVPGIHYNLRKSDGWVLQRPVAADPLPEIEGSVISAQLVGGAAETLRLESDGWWSRIDDINVWFHEGVPEHVFSWRADHLQKLLIQWSWISKPEQIVVEETRDQILRSVLGELDKAESNAEDAPITDELRFNVVQAIQGRAA